jgi:hypothetical protein
MVAYLLDFVADISMDTGLLFMHGKTVLLINFLRYHVFDVVINILSN